MHGGILLTLALAIPLASGVLDRMCLVNAPPIEFGGTPPSSSCTSCSCESSKGAKFYNPFSKRAACCSANTTATYRVKFTATWSSLCHQDYPADAKWSEFVATSHQGSVKIFDACFMDVSEGLKRLAEQGDASLLVQQFAVMKERKQILDYKRGSDVASGTGSSEVFNLTAHPHFPYVSTAVMQGGSADRIMGVSQLRLCKRNGQWVKYRKVCVELFSTATNSTRVGKRNSVQGESCSFGYFEFVLMETTPLPPPPPKDVCKPKPAQICPKNVTSSIIKSCPTCCCITSHNAKFYHPEEGKPLPTCTAPTAVYEVTLQGTWSQSCHNDYYFSASAWSPFSAVSHNYSYVVWNPCMYNVSRGVALLSQTGATAVLEQEYKEQGDAVKCYTKGEKIPGSGNSTRLLSVDADRPLVSVATMLVPSKDRMMGVAGLQLCEANQWKKKVKVCGELFSTATKTDALGRPNTLQMNNCSFGYFEFTLKYVLPPATLPPPPPTPPPKHRDECPSVEGNPPANSCQCQPKIPRCTKNPVAGCSTCCCKSSDNVEFFNPSGPNQQCTASGATYRATFVGTWTARCHPDYYFSSAHWSPLTGISHDPSYEVWNSCMYDVSLGVERVSRFGSTGTVRQEYMRAGSKVKDIFQGSTLFPGAGTRTDTFTVDANHSYVTAMTMLAPSPDRMMGVSRLQLCDGTCWRDSVVVCGELFSTATASRLLGRPNTIQFNNCSFGYFKFDLLSCEGGECSPCPKAPPPPSCIPPPPSPPPTKAPGVKSMMTPPPPQRGMKGGRFVNKVCKRNGFVFRGMVTSVDHLYTRHGFTLCLHVKIIEIFKCNNCGFTSVRVTYARVYVSSVDSPIELGMSYLFAGNVKSCPKPPMPGREPPPVSVDVDERGHLETWNNDLYSSRMKALKCKTPP
jgi:hypothetical protein